MEIKKIYFAFAFIEIIFILGSVNAVAPNPGHALTELEKANCTTSGQFLKAIGRSVSEGYDCATPSGGGSQWVDDQYGIHYNRGDVAIGASSSSSNTEFRVARLDPNGVAAIFTNEGTSTTSHGVSIQTMADVSNIYSFQVIGSDGVNDKYLYVSGDGKVGIGTSNPLATLDVDGNIRTDGAIKFYDEIMPEGLLCDPGDIIFKTASGFWECVALGSSRNYKENIKDFSLGLSAVEMLRPISFKWKGNKNHGENDIGFIAEEVEKIDPLLVTYLQGKIEGVKYDKLTAVLVNAIKEQQTQIEQLKKENSELQKSAWEQHREISDSRNAICEISPNNEICN